ncbi:MAG: NHL repeat-containing protein, partial [Chitinophagales bacterium]
DNNRVVSVDKTGVIQQTLTDFERPMHLDSQDGVVYVPEYGTDNILKLQGEKRDTLSLAKADSLDAPAGVSVLGDEIAIADFYNHRILYFNGSQWQSFGKEGKAEGEFYYPTDVQMTQDKIYVADAYNNRVQVWNKTGGVEQIIGVEEKMNATTGLYVSENQLFATDFENDRVLVYDLTGKLQQTISENVTKPTDMLVIDQQLYVCSYKDKALLVYER